jgi:two-component system, NarL family, sensor kinase
MRGIFTTIFLLFLSLNGFPQYNAKTVADLRTELKSAPDTLIGKVYNKIFVEFYTHSLFDSGVAISEEAVAKARELKDRKFESTAMVWEGMVEFEKGNYDKTVELYVQALKIKDEIKDLKGESAILINLASVYYDRNNLDKATEIYMQALDLKIKLKDIKGQGTIYSNLGNIAEIRTNYKEAINYYLQSRKIAQEVKDERQEAIADRALANVYLNVNNIKDAEALARQAYSILKKGNDRHYTQCLTVLGKVYFEKKAYAQSLEYLTEAFNNSIKNKTPFLTKDACFEMVKVYAALKNVDESRFYQKMYARINDSLQGAKMSEKLADMQVKYETEKKEKAIEHLGLENSKKELELTKKRDQVFFISGILICVMAFFIAFYFYSNFKKHQAINEEKHKRQKEIIETIITTEEKARKKIAADLHDGLGQILTAAKINLANLNEGTPQEKGKLLQVTELVASALYESKNMALNLMPLTLKENGLVESIRHVCAKYNKPEVQEISFNSYKIPDKLEPLVEINTYRICQELLNNAVKYSKATKIFLQLFCRDNKLIIQIEDNGIGFDKTQVKQDSLGMNTLKERVALLQGEIEIDSVPQKGTNIFIELSL